MTSVFLGIGVLILGWLRNGNTYHVVPDALLGVPRDGGYFGGCVNVSQSRRETMSWPPCVVVMASVVGVWQPQWW
ncbi:MAG TPA: hypothetical protein ACQGQH_07840 [Xylella sp.]